MKPWTLRIDPEGVQSLALQRQVSDPISSIRPEGAVPFAPLGSALSGRVGIGVGLRSWR